MITRAQTNPRGFPVSPEVEKNLLHLEDVLSQIEKAYGKPLALTNALRSMAHHKAIYEAKNAALKKAGKPPVRVPMGSKHLYGQAADVADASGAFWKWCMDNLPLMEKLGVYFEDRSATPTWVHIQTVAPGSGKRVFMP